MAGLFKSIFSSRDKLPEPLLNGSYFYPLGFTNNIFTENNYLKQFQEIPELNAVINIVARMDASWKLEILSKRTGEPTENETLSTLLRTPNWFQAQSEFWRQSSMYRSIYGNEFLYFLSPVGMPDNIKGMFTLDPSKVEIKYKSKNLYFMESNAKGIEYWYDLGNGEKTQLKSKNIIHLNDNRVNPDKILTGTSKIESLQAPLHNIREAYRKRNVILKMPVGILSNGNTSDATGLAIPMTDTEKKGAQNQLREHGSLPIVTNMAINYNDMNVNANNMGLFQEVRTDTERLCDAFGVPYELLANEKGTTFTNLKEAKKQMYEETSIPNGKERTDALNMYMNNETIEISASYWHLAVFSEDVKARSISLKQMVEALSKALADGAISIEQYQTELKKFGI